MLDENNNTTLHNGRSYHPFNHIFNIINRLRIKKQNLWHDPREEVNSLIRHHASIAPIFVTRANPPGLVLKVTRSQSLPEVGEKPNRRPSSTFPYASLVVVFLCSESNRVCVCVSRWKFFRRVHAGSQERGTRFTLGILVAVFYGQ